MDLEDATGVSCPKCGEWMSFDRRVFDRVIWKCANASCGHEDDGPEPGERMDLIRQKFGVR